MLIELVSRGRGRGGCAALLAVLVAAPLAAVPALAQGTLSALETDVERIARSTRPSVVTVFAQSPAPRAVPPRRTPRPDHVKVGSGVAVEVNTILTTASVAYGADRLWVRTVNGLTASAELVSFDPIFNIAVLRVDGLKLPPARFADPAIQEGDWVMAIGTADFNAKITQSVGNIATRHREPRLSLLQVTNTVYPGFSGGGLFDTRGELAGLVQGELVPSDLDATTDRHHRPSSMSFVLPVEVIRPVYETLVAQGRVPHGYLGVSTLAESVTSDTQAGLQVPIGARVETVQADGPAARVGLRRGDLIVGFDTERVEYPNQLARWVAATRPGTSIRLVWARNEIQHSARVVLSESPQAVPPWALAGPSSETEPQSSTKIDDLERQIQRLNRELERLKNQSTPSR